MKRSNERSEIIATGETCGKWAPNAPTLKGLNVKRSNSLREIIATGETCGKWAPDAPNAVTSGAR
jgi:hypothetical protein